MWRVERIWNAGVEAKVVGGRHGFFYEGMEASDSDGSARELGEHGHQIRTVRIWAAFETSEGSSVELMKKSITSS